MSLHNLERRFGITAVKKGFITAEQLIEALSTQVMEELEGAGHRLIVEILFEKKYLTAVLIREVLKLLGISENLMSRVQQPAITSTDEDAVNDSEALFSSGLKLFWT